MDTLICLEVVLCTYILVVTYVLERLTRVYKCRLLTPCSRLVHVYFFLVGAQIKHNVSVLPVHDEVPELLDARVLHVHSRFLKKFS